MAAINFVVVGIACTTFFINHKGQMVFGRNYDWITGTGVVNTNLRGMQKTSLQPGDNKRLTWVSNYGSITFNQYGKEFPTGGMNEKGLVVELMWLDESEFPKPDHRPALSVLQWIQYQLDNCSTIEEVIATDEKVRINDDGAPQHYLVADANGNAATIEFLNGKMVVHKGSNLPYSVLANSTYSESFKALRNKSTAVTGDNSLQRFGTACTMIEKLKQENSNQSLIDYSFNILNEVASGDYTKWSIVYDISNKKIFFKTAEYKDVKTVDVNCFDFSCTAKAYTFDMNQKGNGDISKKFTLYSNRVNEKKLKQAFQESKNNIEVEESKPKFNGKKMRPL